MSRTALISIVLAVVWFIGGILWGFVLVRHVPLLGQTHLDETVHVSSTSATIDVVVQIPATNQTIRTHVHDLVPH